MNRDSTSSSKCSLLPRARRDSARSAFVAVLRTLSVSVSALLFTGCYTLTQGIEQAKLMSRRKPVAEVLRDGDDKPERLAKLRLVPEVLKFAEARVGLTPGASYQTYISLDRPALSYVVQAAEKRRLKLKTWWFPVVGAQPYLGFFDRQKAVDFQKKLVDEGYDTSMGGVQAFSLLGYFPDPVYSSMLDGNDELAFVELLFHETVHRTVYVPDAYTFNENLAEFVARHATLMFMRERGDLLVANSADVTANAAATAEAYELKHARMQVARSAFGEFLNIARRELNEFYDKPEVQQLDLPAFLKARDEKVAALNERFQKDYGERIKDTHYARFFQPARFNNATLLGASVYEARQEPFAQLLEKCRADLAKFMQAIKKCVDDVGGSEQDVWPAVEKCGG